MSDTKTFGCVLIETGTDKTRAALSELPDTRESRLLLANNMGGCSKTTALLNRKPLKAGKKILFQEVSLESQQRIQKTMETLRSYYDSIHIETPPAKEAK